MFRQCEDECAGEQLYEAVDLNDEITVRNILLINSELGNYHHSLYFFDNTPLHLASMKGFEHIVMLLLDNATDVNILDTYNSTPLHCAARFGHTRICEILLRYNANVNSIDEYGRTCLHEAADYGHDCTIDLLIRYGAEVNCLNAWNMTPIQKAAANGHTTTILLLLQHDSNGKVNNADNDGNTALHMAAKYNHATTGITLIQNGGDLSLVNNLGLTPLNITSYYCGSLLLKTWAITQESSVSQEGFINLCEKEVNNFINLSILHRSSLLEFIGLIECQNMRLSKSALRVCPREFQLLVKDWVTVVSYECNRDNSNGESVKVGVYNLTCDSVENVVAALAIKHMNLIF